MAREPARGRSGRNKNPATRREAARARAEAGRERREGEKTRRERGGRAKPETGGRVAASGSSAPEGRSEGRTPARTGEVGRPRGLNTIKIDEPKRLTGPRGPALIEDAAAKAKDITPKGNPSRSSGSSRIASRGASAAGRVGGAATAGARRLAGPLAALVPDKMGDGTASKDDLAELNRWNTKSPAAPSSRSSGPSTRNGARRPKQHVLPREGSSPVPKPTPKRAKSEEMSDDDVLNKLNARGYKGDAINKPTMAELRELEKKTRE